MSLKIVAAIRVNSVIKYTALSLLLIQTAYASTYTLDRILKSAAQNNTLSEALQQETLALESKNKADTASDPLTLYGAATKAYPHSGPGGNEYLGSGNEYTAGLLKKFMLGDIQAQEQEITRLSNQATLLEKEKGLLNFKNGLKNIYHQHCLDRQNQKSFKQSYQEFAKLYKKKEKAYQYDEISKTELMQLEIEKNRLYAQLQEMEMRQEISKQNLFMLSKIYSTQSTQLSCEDMYPIKTQVNLGNTFDLSKEAYQKRIQSTQAALKRHSGKLESVDILAEYNEELDVDKYSVGLVIPLTFTSKKSEHERAAAMYQNSTISLQYEQMMTEKKSLLAQLKSYLKSNAMMVQTLKRNYQNYQKNLLPLIKKSYALGETSVIEYLLNRQRSYQLREEIYATKKAYYNTLFKLYTLSEKKDNR